MKSDYMESQKFCTCIEIRKNFKNCVVLCAFQCFVFFVMQYSEYDGGLAESLQF